MSGQANPVKYGCHCDLESMPEGFGPDDCVMDSGEHSSCVYAMKLRIQGKGKADCDYWLPIKKTPSDQP